MLIFEYALTLVLCYAYFLMMSILDRLTVFKFIIYRYIDMSLLRGQGSLEVTDCENFRFYDFFWRRGSQICQKPFTGNRIKKHRSQPTLSLIKGHRPCLIFDCTRVFSKMKISKISKSTFYIFWAIVLKLSGCAQGSIYIRSPRLE